MTKYLINDRGFEVYKGDFKCNTTTECRVDDNNNLRTPKKCINCESPDLSQPTVVRIMT